MPIYSIILLYLFICNMSHVLEINYLILSYNKCVYAVYNIIFLHIPCYSEYLAESLYAFMFNKTFVIVIVIIDRTFFLNHHYVNSI